MTSKTDEILDEKDPFVDPLLDPKTNWAIKNSHFFPIEINKASYKDLQEFLIYLQVHNLNNKLFF